MAARPAGDCATTLLRDNLRPIVHKHHARNWKCLATSLFALTCLSGITSRASAIEVAKGCDAPPTSSHGHTFYIDPQRGSMTNDGSEARPWRTLAEVMAPQNHMVATRKHRENTKDGSMLAVNPQGPIKPGDTLVLMNGDHGDVDIRQYANTDFISVVAGKDQTPLINSLHVIASSHWLFKGLKFQKIRPAAEKFRSLVWFESHGWLGPSDNIVFIDNSVSTANSTKSWTEQDWVDKPYYVGLTTTASCTALIHNHFFNLRNVIGISPATIRSSRTTSSNASAMTAWTSPPATLRCVRMSSATACTFRPSRCTPMQFRAGAMSTTS